MPYFLFGLVTMLLWVFCIVDVITRNEREIVHLPKMGWLVVVIVLPTVGSLLWLFVGRGQDFGTRVSTPRTGYGEYERPGRHVAQNPEDDEEFLRRCRERAEEQRRIARKRREQNDS
ncbi:PLD nuclease N-terminal domain-containing protein [Rhodococcus sp. NPDC058521]|uniref:PLD nuclease N-terminal domain-containing protein n=1 Tax=Rhodococcus sp. NPDC058521 TaxID=3346536 RepID=UPI00364D4534